MDILDELEAAADRIFDRNMERHGFSFTPLGIFRAAYDAAGRLEKNWRLKMRQHQPEPAEHPKLYEPPRYITARYFEHSKRKQAAQ